MENKRPLYVYYQAPESGEWKTIGAYRHDQEKKLGSFTYLESYVENDSPVSIDPFNLPIRQGPQIPFACSRYGGLHDVLRDSGPDGWGRYLLSKFSGVKQDASSLEFLRRSKNHDRWGALAIGDSVKAPTSFMDTPTFPGFDLLVDELAALEDGKPAVDAKLRRRLQEYSGGGARPKATVRDKDGALWIAKPRSRHDHPETPVLEYFCHTWGSLIGLNIARTQLETTPKGNSVALIKRFDRDGSKRILCLSAASAMGHEYPSSALSGAIPPSYPLLASKLKLIGAPLEDRKELFDRMVFNALCGNDDDHTRNHALVFDASKKGWRLSPAYDLVPTLNDPPTHLAMCISVNDRRISTANILSGYAHFGFLSAHQARERLEFIAQRSRECFLEVAPILGSELRSTLQKQIDCACKVLVDGDAEVAAATKNRKPAKSSTGGLTK